MDFDLLTDPDHVERPKKSRKTTTRETVAQDTRVAEQIASASVTANDARRISNALSVVSAAHSETVEPPSAMVTSMTSKSVQEDTEFWTAFYQSGRTCCAECRQNFDDFSAEYYQNDDEETEMNDD